MLEVLRGVDLNDFCTPTKLCQSFTTSTRKTLVFFNKFTTIFCCNKL